MTRAVAWEGAAGGLEPTPQVSGLIALIHMDDLVGTPDVLAPTVVDRVSNATMGPWYQGSSRSDAFVLNTTIKPGHKFYSADSQAGGLTRGTFASHGQPNLPTIGSIAFSWFGYLASRTYGGSSFGGFLTVRNQLASRTYISTAGGTSFFRMTLGRNNGSQTVSSPDNCFIIDRTAHSYACTYSGGLNPDVKFYRDGAQYGTTQVMASAVQYTENATELQLLAQYGIYHTGIAAYAHQVCWTDAEVLTFHNWAIASYA